MEYCSFSTCYTSSKDRQQRKSRRRLFRVVQLGLLAWVAPSLTVAAFIQPPLQPPPCRRSSAISASFSSLTVKELRQLVKESTAEKGLLSRLKKKQDLINFLDENLQGLPSISEDSTQNQPKRRPALSMPPIQLQPEDEPCDSKTSPVVTTPPVLAAPKSSPKDAIFEQVYQRYPPVRDAPPFNYTSPMEDVRQLHHPIFRNNNVSSDMDICFIGTASCTPGATRGVSCTALRLNWRRRAAFLDSSTGRMEQVSSFQGGTWLFDVGECTQVCPDSPNFCCVHLTRQRCRHQSETLICSLRLMTMLIS
jgi:hypothetical protein